MQRHACTLAFEFGYHSGRKLKAASMRLQVDGVGFLDICNQPEMGGHGFGMLISFFGAWRPRHNLGIRFEPTIL
jgi:hypothetical protein